ncbi:MAG: winged helix-turn-helix domain-containing protein [Candidatus Omnitrophica bacterium]|nr:winged helix-turn-helix domain-containing protein [Candidatus Omnitrophota bacterium]
MITKLGIMAGEIWHLLDKEDKISLDEIYNKIDSPKDIVLMSIGWLAREGHVVLEGEAPNHIVSLRRK